MNVDNVKTELGAQLIPSAPRTTSIEHDHSARPTMHTRERAQQRRRRKGADHQLIATATALVHLHATGAVYAPPSERLRYEKYLAREERW